jgi:hypothetical protein
MIVKGFKVFYNRRYFLNFRRYLKKIGQGSGAHLKAPVGTGCKAKIIHGLVERCIQLFVLTVHFRFQDYEYVSFQPFALLPH